MTPKSDPRSPSEILADLPETLAVGLAQSVARPGTTDDAIRQNVLEMGQLIDEAARRGAEVVILPEYWPFGFIPADRLHAIAETVPSGPLSSFLIEKARQHHIYVCGGTICERGSGGKIYNTDLLIDPRGHLIGRHPKVNLYSPLGEDRLFTAGDDFSVVQTAFGNVGVLTCYDGDFPETSRLLRLKGAHIIFQVAAYESPLENWWQVLYAAQALANSVWLIQVGLAGNYQWFGADVHCFGMSRVVAPTGEVVDSATYYPANTPQEQMQSEVKVVRLDYRRALIRARTQQDCLIFDRRPDLYAALAAPKE